MQVCYLLNLQNVPECRSRVIFNYWNQRDRKGENKFAFKRQKLFEKTYRDLTRENAMKSSHISNDCSYVAQTIKLKVKLKNEATMRIVKREVVHSTTTIRNWL